MVVGYPNGLTKKDIPYEGQIIRVADEYDAIVSKRQYKTHVGISDTLKILIEDTIPNNPNAKEPHYGKNNPIILKALFKVVIADIEYEIYSTQSYVDDLENELKRFKKIFKYKEKMDTAKKEKDKNYYYEGMKMLFKDNEDFDNYLDLYEEYKDAYEKRKAIIDNLYKEIKIIKKLKV